MVALRHTHELADELSALTRSLETIEFGSGLADLESTRDRLVAAIRTYLIPRSRNPDLPMSVVFAGPTGSGKSTLINSLSGRDLSPAGFLRPTTSRPIALASPANVDDYWQVGDVSCDVISGRAPILEMMTLIDTPDIDSTARRHRLVAEALIDNADVVVFVASALRYADAVPWQVLRRAESRGSHVVHVLNRVGSATSGAVVDFRARLAAAGFDDDIVVIPEHHLARDAQRIPSLAVRSLKRSLATIANDRAARARAIFDQVCRTTLGQTIELIREIDRMADREEAAAEELALYVVDRLDELDLGSASAGVIPHLPENANARARRRWVRANRMEPPTVAVARRRIADRIHGIVLSDLMSFVDDESVPVGWDSRLGESLANAIEKWTVYVGRVAAEATAGGLGAVVLLGAACSGPDRGPEPEALFGDEADAFVERVRRELQGRLAVVYSDTISSMIETAGQGVNCPDDVHAAIGAVSVTLAPADA